MWGLLFIYLPEIAAAGTWLQVRHSLFFPDTQTSQNFDSIYIQNYNDSALWLLSSDLQSMPLLDPLDHELGFPLATVKGKWFVNIKWIAHLLLTRWELGWRYYHHYVQILSGCECVSNKCGVELDLMYWQDVWTQCLAEMPLHKAVGASEYRELCQTPADTVREAKPIYAWRENCCVLHSTNANWIENFSDLCKESRAVLDSDGRY